MDDPENLSGLTLPKKTNVVVVVVRHGESQGEAWRRYLADHPESFGVDVRIFHYSNPMPSPPKS